MALGLLLLLGCGGEGGSAGGSGGPGAAPAPVEVAVIERDEITLRRTFSGTLEPSTLVQVAARVGGRLARVAVDLGDEVKLGDLIAEIDAAELDSSLLSSEADLAVAKATVTEAEAAAKFANRVLERLQALDKDGVASKSELDSARAQASARAASVAVAQARVQRAESALVIARLQRAEADVLATWSQAGSQAGSPSGSPSGSPPDSGADGLEALSTRAVSERYVDEGELVSAGTPLVQLVGLHPVVAVVFVPERDYARLVPGAVATLTTDAYLDETFEGRVTRVAPVFSRSTRQVRVELQIPNETLRLKPGMFIRATLELASVPGALVVPYEALTKRDGTSGLFVLAGKGGRDASTVVRWVPVKTGIREGERIEVEALAGVEPLTQGTQVVLLGQELCDDGSSVTVPDGRAQGPRVTGSGGTEAP